MFAGIVEAVGQVQRVGPAAPAQRGRPAATRLQLSAAGFFDGLKMGASVAVNGVCLTLAAARADQAEFDVVPETLRLTNLGRCGPGDAVNLERSLRSGDRIDGHFVQGHVDEIAELEQVERSGGDFKLWVRHSGRSAAYIVRKGSIALDGVSLTVVDAEPQRFSVVIIPTTWERTTLGRIAPGHPLNIETDILMRAVVARVDALLGGLSPATASAAGCEAAALRPGGLTLEQLRESGFAP